MFRHFSRLPHRPVVYASLALGSSLLATVWLIAPGSAGTRSVTMDRVVSADSNNWKPSKAANGDAHRLVNKKESFASYGELPLAYEANCGQANEEVRFISRGSGYNLFLTSSEAVLALRQTVAPDHRTREVSRLPTGSRPVREAVLRWRLADANPVAEVIGIAELPGKANYFIGNDPAKWRTDVPTYGMVKYQSVYPGVDMIYHGNQRQLEYDFVVSPGANPETIAMQFSNAKSLHLDRQGDLVIKIKGGRVRLRKPDIYQEIDGVRKTVEGGYKLLGRQKVGFRLGGYDPGSSLVIDPVLVYSTYLGGSAGDVGRGIAVDSGGNAYVVGVTFSSNFPVINSAQTATGGGPDSFIAKLNPAGNVLMYSTYLGGNGQDFGNSIAVDGAGNAYVTGDTDSANFPTVNPFQASYGSGQDAFVAKLSSAGNALIYSTYLGVISYDSGRGIAVDVSGNAYVTGYTYFNTFPKVNPAQPIFGGSADAFVAKFTPPGNALVYSTFLGGNNYDYGFDIALDSTNNAYVTGWTVSTNFPTVGPAQTANAGGGGDAFVAKLNSAGSAFTYATYLGGNGTEYGQGVAVDASGIAHVTGYTTSTTNFPIVNAAQPSYNGGVSDGFVTRLNGSGNVFTHSTYLGGSGEDKGNGIAVDAVGNAYIAGDTSSTNFPMLTPLQGTFGGGYFDGFVSRIAPPGTISFSTFLGGTSDDQFFGIAVDNLSAVYLTGRTFSLNFPKLNPYQAALAGNDDAVVVKISIDPPCVAPPNTTMVAWYPFDEATGFTAANLATGNTGSLVNNPGHYSNGKVSRAIIFNGTNQYVQSPSSIVTNIGPAGLPQTCSGSYSTCRGDFSIDAWINLAPTASLGVSTIVDKRATAGSATNGYLFFVLQRNRLGVQLADGSGFSNYLSPVIPGLAGNWHHVAVTVSRRSPVGIKWYDNGTLIGVSNPTVGATRYGSLVNNSPFRIGLDSWLGAGFLGVIDELEMFNRELSSAEVNGIFKADTSGKCK